MATNNFVLIMKGDTMPFINERKYRFKGQHLNVEIFDDVLQ